MASNAPGSPSPSPRRPDTFGSHRGHAGGEATSWPDRKDTHLPEEATVGGVGPSLGSGLHPFGYESQARVAFLPSAWA